MKKLFVILIALLFTIESALFSGCVGGNDTSLGGESSADGSSETESSKDESSKAESSKPDASSGDTSSEESKPAPEYDYYTLISHSKPYTSSPAASDTYPDSYGCELTDGIHASASSYTDINACGFNGDTKITLDLGDDGKMLNRFSVSYIATYDAGLGPLSACTVFGSDDNGEWTLIGRLTIPTFESGTIQEAVLTADEHVSFRYIMFNCSKSVSWLFLDEVSVFADIEPDESEASERVLAAYESDGLVKDAVKNALKELSTGKKPDSSLVRIEASKGGSYKIEASGTDERSPDDKVKLTDGAVTGSSFQSGCWVGINASEGGSITVTSASASDIYSLSLYAYSREAANIFMPTYVDFYAGNSASELSLIGRVYAPSLREGNFRFEIALTECIKASVIRFSFPAHEGFCWFEEAGSYAYRKLTDTTTATVYPPLVMPEVTEDSFWSESEKDYDKNINLIFGLTQQISCKQTLLAESFGESNDKADTTLLTDGVQSGGTYCYDGKWNKFCGGSNRDIIYDLTRLSSVNEFSVRFLEYYSWAIKAPNTFTLYLSDDGVNWYGVYNVTTNEPEVDGKVLTLSSKLDKTYRARFVRLSFTMSNFIFIDEIRVLGTKKVGSDAAVLASSGIASETMMVSKLTNEYMAPSEDLLGGVNDVMLAYHTSSSFNYDKDFYLQYTAYIGTDNVIKDTLFDGFLFLPTVSTLPSGGMPYSTSNKGDWDWLFNSLFKSGQNVEALNQAAAETGKATGNDNYKVKVFFTLMLLDNTVTDFGDIDGDGKSENLSLLADRVKVAEWYIDRVTAKFNEGNYEHLELCGWYWFNEAIESDNGDYDTIPAVSEALHKRNSQLFWIPYYCASGYGVWEELGFDVACMQPNYAFDSDVAGSRLAAAASIIKMYGMCIEIETSAKALTDDLFFRKYMDYLSSGITEGYMDGAIHMYYQDISAIASARTSSDKKTRLIYDYTYQFIKGTLSTLPAVDAIAESCEADKPFSGKLGDEMQYIMAVSPSHGSVTVNENGSYIYYPEKGYTGTDSFSYRIGNYLGWSEQCTVTITIG